MFLLIIYAANCLMFHTYNNFSTARDFRWYQRNNFTVIFTIYSNEYFSLYFQELKSFLEKTEHSPHYWYLMGNLLMRFRPFKFFEEPERNSDKHLKSIKRITMFKMFHHLTPDTIQPFEVELLNKGNQINFWQLLDPYFSIFKTGEVTFNIFHGLGWSKISNY